MQEHGTQRHRSFKAVDGGRLARHGDGSNDSSGSNRANGGDGMNESQNPAGTSRLTDSLGALSLAAFMQPFKSTDGLRRATAELIKVTTGQSTIAPQANDRRFDDPAWQDNGMYRRLMQAHLAVVQEIHRVAGELDLPPRDEARAKMMLGMVTDALAPTNTLAGNPAALKRTIETSGLNLVEGVRQMAADWRDNGGLPSSVDGSGFVVGENVAATPGSVVHRDELLELIQYQAQTDSVHGTPLFIVPPQINKYYVWDLAPWAAA
jgi:polyhydroxyalkanoate synthase